MEAVMDSLGSLKERGILSHDQVAQLEMMIRMRSNFAVCGTALALKHTLMRALAAYAADRSPSERIVVVTESTEGYSLPDANMAALQFSDDQPFDKVLAAAMRMAPDRLMVDTPLKGPAAYDVLQAMVHTRGSGICLNASAESALTRLNEAIHQHPDGALAAGLAASSVDVFVDVRQRGPGLDQPAIIAFRLVAAR